MAILEQKQGSGSNAFFPQLADQKGDIPAGVFKAKILEVKDMFKVSRTKYQSTETELVDLTCFLLGFRDQANQPYMIATKPMRISGNVKSALMLFLTNLLGKAPQMGWDYAAVRGMECMITVLHIPKNDGSGVYANVTAVMPLMVGNSSTPPPAAPAAAAPVAAPAAAPAAQQDDSTMPF